MITEGLKGGTQDGYYIKSVSCTETNWIQRYNIFYTSILYKLYNNIK